MKFFYWKVIVVALTVGFIISNQSAAAIGDITADLKQLNGYVVMSTDDEYLIDLDAKHGVEVGDLFSVIGVGEEIVHPISQKVIGTLEEVKGVLRVVRISEGFSFARLLGGPTAIKRGDPIQRFTALKALFWDYSGKNKALFERLQKDLPALKWQDYQVAQDKRPLKPAPQTGRNDVLMFIINNNFLEVRDAQLGLIRQYPLPAVTPAGQTMGTAPVTGASTRGAEPQQTAGTSPAFEKEMPSIVDYGSANAVAQLSDNTLMADMLQYNNYQLLAVTDSKKISVYTMESELKLLAEGTTRGYGQIMAVKWWYPVSEGPLYLVALAWSDDKIDSTVFVLEKNRLEPVAMGLDTILGSFDLNNDGRPETLLSQEFDAESFFGRRIKEAYWHNSQLQQRNHKLPLPAKFTVIGGQLADLTSDGKLEAVYVRNGILWIYSGKKLLYNSAKQMGGSLSVLTYKVNPTVIDYRTTSVFFEIAPVAIDIDNDGRMELISISSDQSAIKVPGIMSTIDNSRLMVFKYNQGTFIKGTIGEPVDAAIQGLEVVDGQIVYVATEPGSLFDQGGSSRLQALDIAL